MTTRQERGSDKALETFDNFFEEYYRFYSETNFKGLNELIRSTPFLQIGKKFGVSDNAIRKWCKNCQLPSSPRKIKKYSDEEWKNI